MHQKYGFYISSYSTKSISPRNMPKNISKRLVRRIVHHQRLWQISMRLCWSYTNLISLYETLDTVPFSPNGTICLDWSLSPTQHLPISVQNIC